VLVPLARRRLSESHGPADKLDIRGLLLAGTGLFGVTFGIVRATARLAQRLGSLARRPQTGQLHEYYAQAAVALAAALLLVLVVR